jgi:hypothetical protein
MKAAANHGLFLFIVSLNSIALLIFADGARQQPESRHFLPLSS